MSNTGFGPLIVYFVAFSFCGSLLNSKEQKGVN